MPRVLVTLKLPLDHLAPLDGVARIEMPDTEWDIMPRTEVLERVPGCDAVICQGELRIDDELLDAAGPGLRIVANVAMGIDNFDLPTLTRRGVQATNTPDAFVESTADLTLGLILATARRIPEGDRFVRSGAWEPAGFQPVRWEGMLLRGRTLGLVGYGQIARAVEERAVGFGLRCLHTRSRASDDPRCRTLPRLLEESDIVALHVPHTEGTHHLIGPGELARMKPGAILVNVARGKVVDEAALVEALGGGHLGGAGLDVFEAEPRVHPALREMDNVVLVPHLGGSTVEDRRRGRLQAAENVARVLAGEPPVTPVNRIDP